MVILLASAGFPAHAQTADPAQLGPYSGQMPTPSPYRAAAGASAVTSVGGANAAAAVPPRLQFFGAVDVSEGYESQAGGYAYGRGSGADEFTRGGVQLAGRYNGSRLTADVHYSLQGYYYYRDQGLNRIDNRLNLVARDNLIPDHLIVTVMGFAAPATLARFGAISPSGGAVSNTYSRDAYGYEVEPRYFLRFDDFASSQTSITQSGAYFSQPGTYDTGGTLPFQPVQNSSSTTVSERIDSGSDFARLHWTAGGYYNYTTESTLWQKSSEGVLALAYAVDRSIALLATGGYDNYDASVPLTRDLNGPTGLGGVRFTPGPNFELIVQAGQQHNFTSVIGSLRWKITQRMALNGSLTDAVTTPQGNIFGALSSLQADQLGNFSYGLAGYGQNSGFGLAPQYSTISPVSENGLALDQSINRDRTARLSLTETAGQTQYGISAYGELRDRLDRFVGPYSPHSSLWGVRAGADQRIQPELTANASVSYSFADEFGGHDRILTGVIGAAYQFSEKLSGFATVSYVNRQSQGLYGVSGAPLSDVEVLIGVRQAF